MHTNLIKLGKNDFISCRRTLNFFGASSLVSDPSEKSDSHDSSLYGRLNATEPYPSLAGCVCRMILNNVVKSLQ